MNFFRFDAAARQSYACQRSVLPNVSRTIA
jgi:hypothetical protein